MSWRANLSKHLPVLRFFACADSPSSNGIRKWYAANYQEICLLNPNFQFLMRTGENCMPAVTTHLDFQVDDVLRFMIQTNKFKNTDGSIAANRIEAAKAYLGTDWPTIRRERWSSPGFDPESPFVEAEHPEWKDDARIAEDLQVYISLKGAADAHMEVIKSGPNDEYTRAENALLMCQRVDLWCAGPSEVEAAVQHLYKLGQHFNDVTPDDDPEYISEFYPGQEDL
mmetsp:Transcript_10459/g.15955  ORF Transcript_10459/g.15955 Transcript_10459/m.15955 type:complete len:226 (+) Transcript_10459:124-801(+)|eukprot:CAMPEP_0118693856 /NCGR_PEP_ID=MMETSP0800-20121206/12161_1 /TAXON_ID=210618 ORGANISM="Striatella unipunctata, Strain CCMP2910" /NCGR_SAMPLE_ID=MMETSP0800 /ASSEMBLY_ACC=CAM_ASM_000638 /LENGTH=225 /DNA_ID=CAMNT_0006592179 /DNA_START=97 /DNA_END=774 /DNA_ORIENTATION=+